ncbi:MAG: pyridoxamine 5'-phosphate oxidase family protein [Helicobacteraceae bacterium]|jgi:nitroimidazol reductase NimA-like FMN-containing flavoprotein (pyridoxamine 5'-phosphate oxidase superfamily)|nr:pyridoxamine 5'-phosphate oxidase family protein [Helicobacteraceae bacterium]
MRRNEYEITDESELARLLRDASYGVIAFNGEFPYITPVNFVYEPSALIFHGAASGRKYEIAAKNPRAAFSVVKEYAIIPSYFRSELACAASAFFISAFLEGHIAIVNDLDRKKEALKSLMKKYQSEGGFESFDNTRKYAAAIEKTAVFEFQISSWTLKSKMGQKLDAATLKKLIENLQKRGAQIDIETIEMIKKFANF